MDHDISHRRNCFIEFGNPLYESNPTTRGGKKCENLEPRSQKGFQSERKKLEI